MKLFNKIKRLFIEREREFDKPISPAGVGAGKNAVIKINQNVKSESGRLPTLCHSALDAESSGKDSTLPEANKDIRAYGFPIPPNCLSDVSRGTHGFTKAHCFTRKNNSQDCFFLHSEGRNDGAVVMSQGPHGGKAPSGRRFLGRWLCGEILRFAQNDR